MSACDIVLKIFESVGYESLLNAFRKAARSEENKNSHFVPIKLKPEQIRKALECQRIMLEFTRRQFRKSLGSEKEEFMRKVYNDAVADYNMFIEQYEKELK